MTETEAWAAQLPPHEGSKSMVNIDTSTEAVERLLENVTPGPWVGRACEVYIKKHVELNADKTPSFGGFSLHDCPDAMANTAFIAAARDLVPALLKERDKAVDAKLDALSTLDAWFDRRKLGNEAVNQAVIDAASGYLRTSRVGGMPQVESDLILGVMQDMSRLGLFADIFARAMNDMVQALLKERDDLRAKLAQMEELVSSYRTALLEFGIDGSKGSGK